MIPLSVTLCQDCFEVAMMSTQLHCTLGPAHPFNRLRLQVVLAACASAAAVLAGCGGGSGGSVLPASNPAPVLAQPLPVTMAGKVFALTDVGDPKALLDDLASRPAVDGLAFRSAWRVLEPQDGVYDWSALDAAMDIVRTRGKRLTLHVGVSSIGIPAWLPAAGAATYTYTTPMGTVTDLVPWDATFAARYTRFVSALSVHVQARGDAGLLHAVSDGAPVGEMSLPGCQGGSLSNGTAYSRASYLAAWKNTVDAHVAAFPSVALFISAPVGVICKPDNDGQTFHAEVMNHALGKSPLATVFAADLNALGSVRLAQVDAAILSRASTAVQTIWSSTNDAQNRMQGTLRDAVCQGLAGGARYFEIYKSDITSADVAIQGAIQLARAGRPCTGG